MPKGKSIYDGMPTDEIHKMNPNIPVGARWGAAIIERAPHEYVVRLDFPGGSLVGRQVFPSRASARKAILCALDEDMHAD